MPQSSPFQWITIAQRIQAIAQAGLEFCHNDFDRDRYKQLREISTEIIENHTKYSKQEIIELFATETGYPTPKVDVRAVIFRENKILMVREKLDGKWSLPGGWADQHLTLSGNLVKESFEEAGAVVEPGKVIAILDRNRGNYPPIPHGCYKIFVECKLKEVVFTDNTETSDAGFFSPDSLPELSTERITQEQIKMCFEARREDWKVVYD
ncbi:MAG: NUDIX hydrolase [Bacteroidales bacterium]|nr:NUDIX hydrolase [Bacteroidales bacterium]